MIAEEEKQKKEEEKARKEFIKQEYLRRKQLKLMEDMDSVIKPRPLSAKQKKPRPKSIHRDVMESPKPSAKATPGKAVKELIRFLLPTLLSADPLCPTQVAVCQSANIQAVFLIVLFFNYIVAFTNRYSADVQNPQSFYIF